MRFKLPIFLDTNVLSTALETRRGTNRLRRFVRNAPATFVFSLMSLEEMCAFDGQDTTKQRILANLHRFGKFWHSVGRRQLRLFTPYNHLIKWELQGAVTTLPVIPKHLEQFYYDMLVDPEWIGQFFEHHRSHLETFREPAKRILEIDRNLSAEVKKRYGEVEADDKNILAMLKSFDRPVENGYWIEIMAGWPGLERAHEAISIDPGRYRCVHALEALWFTNKLANSVSEKTSHTRDEIVGMFKTRSKDIGRFYDDLLMCTASYCNLVLSDDDRCVKRCNELKRRKLLPFHSVRLHGDAIKSWDVVCHAFPALAPHVRNLFAG